MIHLALPSGGSARVSANVSPETMNALDEMIRAAGRMVARKEWNATINAVCVRCGDPVTYPVLPAYKRFVCDQCEAARSPVTIS